MRQEHRERKNGEKRGETQTTWPNADAKSPQSEVPHSAKLISVCSLSVYKVCGLISQHAQTHPWLETPPHPPKSRRPLLKATEMK